ncbi:MAG: fused MFS/spermidine synthase [Chloroflexota bacterium]|nr:fused MFS/spermidine synthase [Chloroflexota bacterium]
MKNKYLYVTVFFSGMTALAVELSASRLLGNVYGSSNLVWACIIGLILIYLTIGYWLGGKLADKYPEHRIFYRILLWGGFAVGLVPIISRPVLRVSANAFDRLQIPAVVGAFVMVLVLFIVPVTLIGMASPFALKLALRDAKNAGKVSGRISAISTLGSFIGTFLPVLVLIPLIGTYRTFLFFSSLLMLIASIGYIINLNFKSWLRYSWMPLILVLLWLFGAQGAGKLTEGMVYETESAYNYIQVIEEDSYRYLRLNEGQGVHSVYHPTQLNYSGPWSQVIVAPFFNSSPHPLNSVENIAIVGLAAGTTARQATVVYGDVNIDGFEIDPKIVEVGRDFFDMTQTNLNVVVQDGRWGLAHSDETYDIISVDAYRPPYIPWHMTTFEFFQIVYERLSDDGVMVINIGRSPLDRTLVNDLSTTIRQVFPTIFVTDLPGSFNSILFATKKPGSWENVTQNYHQLLNEDVHPLLLEAMAVAYNHQQPTPDMTQVYTDDRAPIEWLTNKIVVDYLLSDGLGDMQ